MSAADFKVGDIVRRIEEGGRNATKNPGDEFRVTKIVYLSGDPGVHDELGDWHNAKYLELVRRAPAPFKVGDLVIRKSELSTPGNRYRYYRPNQPFEIQYVAGDSVGDPDGAYHFSGSIEHYSEPEAEEITMGEIERTLKALKDRNATRESIEYVLGWVYGTH